MNELDKELPLGQVITHISLNQRALDTNWYEKTKTIYLLDEDYVEITTENSAVIVHKILSNSKEQTAISIAGFSEDSRAFSFG